MADRVKKVQYCYVKVSNRAGRGAALLGELRAKGVSLLAFSGFPLKGGKAQLDMITDDLSRVRRIADKAGLRPSKAKKGFLVQGKDGAGVVHRHLARLAERKINVTAADALCAGKGRYGMLLWVKPGDYARAAKVLKAE